MGPTWVWFAVTAGAEPTELEKERQELLDMGIDPAVLGALEASAEQTAGAIAAAKQLDAHVVAIQSALQARREVVACQADASKRAGGPVKGSIAWTVTFSAAGAVTEVKELKRDGGVDDLLAGCVAGVLRTVVEAPRPAAFTLELPMTFPFPSAP